MDESKRNPCDVCDSEECWFCALYSKPEEYQCCNRDCFLNFEGDCKIGIFDSCGAWKKDG